MKKIIAMLTALGGLYYGAPVIIDWYQKAWDIISEVIEHEFFNF